MALPDVNHIKVISTFVEDSYDRLKQQFKDKDKIQKLHTVIASLKKEILDQAVILSEARLIDNASGVTLDDIGVFLGVDRGNADDEDYRTALKIRIFRRRTAGTRPDVIDIISRATGTSPTSIDVYTGANKTLDLAFFAGCLDYSSSAKELGLILPIQTNYRFINKPLTAVFGFTSVHAVTDPLNILGFGTVVTAPATSQDSAPICSLITRADLQE